RIPPFAFPPALGYPYWLVGQVWHLFGGAITPLHDRGFQVFWKLAFALFVPVNAILIYYLGRNGPPSRWVLVGVAGYALNPAIASAAVVSGVTQAIVPAALLVSALRSVFSQP